MKKRTIIKKSLIVILITLVITLLIIFLNKDTKITNESIEYLESPIDYVIYEAVGNYAFATAGNNNAYRGTSVNSGDYSWIQSFPESDKVSYNWENVKKQILNETGLTDITNMSGSYLNIDGEVKKALLSAVISKSNGSGYQGRVLLLKPNGKYEILNFNTNYWMTVVDITEYLADSQKGWYYISYLDAAPIPQSGWTIAAVYENSSLEKSYIKMLNVNKTIQNGGQISVMFDSKFKLQKNFHLVGVVMLAGSNGFQVLDPSSSQSSLDRAYAILDDNTEFQLYDRGDGHFTGRSEIDFANSIYSSERSHNIQGGELDIFDEVLDSSYFGGKNIIGYRFIKDGKDLVNISSLGLSQSVIDPNLSVTTKITADSKFKENSNISITSTIKNNLDSGYCYSAYNNEITNTVDNSLSNIKNIKATLNGTIALNATYDSTSRQIIIEEINELTCTDEVVLTFDATINSNIENSIENNKYTITSLINNNYSLIDLNKLTGDELTKYEALKANEEAIDSVTSPKSYKVTINHYKSGTTTKLTDSTTIDKYEGETYTSTPSTSLLTNYNVATPSNATGTISGNTTINYYYTLKQATITVKYLEEGTNTILADTETKIMNYTDTYIYTAKDINNYQFSGVNETVSGTISGDKEIIFYYTRKKATLTIHHYLAGTTTELSSTIIKDTQWGDEYTTAPATVNSKYELVSTPNNATGIITGDTTVIYYYKLKTSIITVHHYIDGTTTKLAESQVFTKNYDDTYTSEVHKDVPNNYELKSKTNNFTGIVSSNTIEIIYYYQKKDSNLTTTISKKGPTEIVKKEEIVKYSIIYNAKVTDYIGDGTITIIDTLPHKLNIELSNLDEGIYDEKTNTITWIIPWTNIDSFNDKGEITIEKNISIVYSDILPSERIMINSVKGSIILDNNSRDIESQTSTNIKIPGKITIHYYLKDTEIPVIDSIEETNLVGENCITSAEELEGYIIIKPETEKYTFTEEEQIVIYYYDKIKVHVKTEVNGNGGTISGDETVNYGEDSTKDKIVIIPEEGYILGTVLINGKKITLTEKDKKGLVLENFHEMKEDITITVTFIKNIEENPNTGSFINYIIILTSIPLFLAIVKYIKNKDKIIKL